MSKECIWIGADPGGKNVFGLAMLSNSSVIKTAVVSCVSEALDFINREPTGVGIDAPMWWSAGPAGLRHADVWIRNTYGISHGTVQATNSLRGSVVVQATMLAEALRDRYPNVKISETHPKALLAARKESGGEFIGQHGINFAFCDEHERDAVISAIAAREGFSERWPYDLAQERYEAEQDPNQYRLAPMHYFWPE